MSSETKKRLLLSKWRGQDLRDEIEKHEQTIADLEWQVDEAERALVDVKYWLLDWLHHRFNIGPRELLRKVEDALQ